MIRQVIIIGSGPAAHTAAIYAARAKLSPLLFEGEMAGGVAAGGQLTTTTDVENFPGFPTGIMGPELMWNMRLQSENCGAEIITKTVDRIDTQSRPFTVYVGDTAYQSHTIIIATGATAKRLGVPGEEIYWQKGMSACAVCDGGLPIFRDKPLIVVGGGDSAVEEAHYLTKFASKVTMLVRSDQLRASKVMQDRAFSTEKIDIMWHSTLQEARGNGSLLTHAVVHNSQTNETVEIEAGGIFYAIGHDPNTQFLNGQIATDDTGYITLPNPPYTQTNVAGIFACGDVQDKVYRQAISAAGTGCMSALDAERYLVDNNLTSH